MKFFIDQHGCAKNQTDGELIAGFLMERGYEFTLNASFRGPCLFRDRVDNSQSVESYFARGDLFTATPRNGIRLWMSNFNTVKITIIADSKSFDLDIGAAGQIFVEDIKWIKDTDGKYKLVVLELD